ncbi:MAG: hypothetical protein CVU04_02425 [Bacteroidetes bacterium HGW-Bacteroidetes-20]|nr:MAG: hypothetical protein CVU04_02425 [Bacteroidetes bacterium HGW-Bacteroidetes-20]
MGRKITIILAFASILLAGCEKFEPAKLHMTALYDPSDKTVTCTVTITDNGGCTNFTEQGGMFSFSENPSHLDQYSTIEVMNKNSLEHKFIYKTRLSQDDVTYFVRAYVKTNAGTGYSNIIAVKTPAK